MKKLTTEERFWGKVEKTDRCWNWIGAINNRGYGNFIVGAKTIKPHRWSWAQVNGDLDPTQYLDHICWNRTCVNPKHPRIVTRKQNAENRSGARTGSTSGVRGVTWHKPTKKWRARVQNNDVRENLGYFANLKDAEDAVIARRLEVFTHNNRDRSGYRVTA